MSRSAEPDPAMIGGVAQPDFARLPDPVALFQTRAKRLGFLAQSSRLGPYLAFLAALSPVESGDIIDRSAERLRAYRGMTAAAMRRLVDNARIRGWAVVGNASVQGVLGVGVALLDGRCRPQVAVSVSSLIDRMTLARQRRIAALIRDELARTGPPPG